MMQFGCRPLPAPSIIIGASQMQPISSFTAITIPARGGLVLGIIQI
jgi:hypothetical protein